MNTSVHTFDAAILEQLSRLQPCSRDEMIGSIEDIIGQYLIEKIETHNTNSIVMTFRSRETASHKLYALKVEYGDDNATAKEINWYKTCSRYDFLPRYVFGHTSATYSLLVMDFIHHAISLDMIHDENNVQRGVDYYKRAIELDRRLYSEHAVRKSDVDETNEFYCGRFKRRLQEVTKFGYLEQLMNSDTVSINGKQYRTPLYYVNVISKDYSLKEYLMPLELGMIHGDLHGGNIFVADDNIYLVDPNGLHEMPLEYDFGKILQSVHGGYHDVMNGSYMLDQEHGEFVFELSPINPRLYDGIKTSFSTQELLRGHYAEAMHFVTMLSHHATVQTETTALFLRSVELFDERVLIDYRAMPPVLGEHCQRERVV